MKRKEPSPDTEVEEKKAENKEKEHKEQKEHKKGRDEKDAKEDKDPIEFKRRKQAQPSSSSSSPHSPLSDSINSGIDLSRILSELQKNLPFEARSLLGESKTIPSSTSAAAAATNEIVQRPTHVRLSMKWPHHSSSLEGGSKSGKTKVKALFRFGEPVPPPPKQPMPGSREAFFARPKRVEQRPSGDGDTQSLDQQLFKLIVMFAGKLGGFEADHWDEKTHQQLRDEKKLPLKTRKAFKQHGWQLMRAECMAAFAQAIALLHGISPNVNASIKNFELVDLLHTDLESLWPDFTSLARCVIQRERDSRKRPVPSGIVIQLSEQKYGNDVRSHRAAFTKLRYSSRTDKWMIV